MDHKTDQRAMTLNLGFPCLKHCNGYSVVNADSFKNICRKWRLWRELKEINIEPFADLDEIVAL